MNDFALKDILTAFMSFLYVKAVNFHTVSKGVLYRSAQLNLEKLSSYVERHRIKSIVNLRGAQRGRRWYVNEKAFSLAKGIVHFDFDLSAVRTIPVKDLEAILDTMRKAPKPILVHCYAGADRTGLIAALWKFAVERESPSTAIKKQLCRMKGHFSTLHIGTDAMGKSFWNYVGCVSPSAGGTERRS